MSITLDETPIVPSLARPVADSARAPIITRPFQPSDAEAVARFWREREFDIPGGVHHDATTIDADYVLRSMKKGRTVWAVVAFMGEQLVGYNEIRQLSGDALHLCYLYLSPEIRGKGWGAEFAFLAFQYVASLPPDQCRRVVSNFSPANVISRRIAARAGCPESAPGRLEVLLPILRTLPRFNQFAERHDLFSSYARYCRLVSCDIPGVGRITGGSQAETSGDRFEWHGVLVYPQRFAADEDWIEILIDARSLGVRRVACPDWSAAVLPAQTQGGPLHTPADCTIEVTNTSARQMPVQMWTDGDPIILTPGDTLRVDAAARRSRPNWRNISVRESIDGQPMTLGARISRARGPSQARATPAPGGRRSIAGRVERILIRGDTFQAVLDPSLDGGVRSLRATDAEFLLVADRDDASLGWIHPWRGGLFYLLQPGRRMFQLDAWGPFPGGRGFNTAPCDCTLEAGRVTRMSSIGRFAETTRFEPAGNELRLHTRVENRSARAASCSFALFAFLKNPPAVGQARAVSAEGTSRPHSRRSFSLESERGVAVEMPDRRLSLDVHEGAAICTAFNLGDDGIHLMAISWMTIGGQDQSTLALTMRLERCAAPADDHA